MNEHSENKPERAANYAHPDPVTDAALEWLLHLQANPHDRALRRAFEAWRQENHAHAEVFTRLAEMWDMPELAEATTRLAQQNGEALAFPAPAHRRTRARFRLPAAVAIAATLLLVAGYGFYPDIALRWQADYITASGAKEEVVLPDGSRMTLNTASAVTIDFGSGKRSVQLLGGEVFFDVVPDPAHPFVVAGRFSEVVVKGTGFSARTDEEGDLVVLEHGVVQVARLPDRKEIVTLNPGDTISASATALSPVRKVDTASSLAWREGRIVFDEQPLALVIREIGRYYASPVFIADGRIGNVVVSGNYRLTDPEGTIRSLATAAGASVSRIPGGILILR